MNAIQLERLKRALDHENKWLKGYHLVRKTDGTLAGAYVKPEDTAEISLQGAMWRICDNGLNNDPSLITAITAYITTHPKYAKLKKHLANHTYRPGYVNVTVQLFNADLHTSFEDIDNVLNLIVPEPMKPTTCPHCGNEVYV